MASVSSKTFILVADWLLRTFFPDCLWKYELKLNKPKASDHTGRSDGNARRIIGRTVGANRSTAVRKPITETPGSEAADG